MLTALFIKGSILDQVFIIVSQLHDIIKDNDVFDLEFFFITALQVKEDRYKNVLWSKCLLNKVFGDCANDLFRSFNELLLPESNDANLTLEEYIIDKHSLVLSKFKAKTPDVTIANSRINLNSKDDFSKYIEGENTLYAVKESLHGKFISVASHVPAHEEENCFMAFTGTDTETVEPLTKKTKSAGFLEDFEFSVEGSNFEFSAEAAELSDFFEGFTKDSLTETRYGFGALVEHLFVKKTHVLMDKNAQFLIKNVYNEGKLDVETTHCILLMLIDKDDFYENIDDVCDILHKKGLIKSI
jgi:hypothetical protein